MGLFINNKKVQRRLCVEPFANPADALQYAISFEEGLRRHTTVLARGVKVSVDGMGEVDRLLCSGYDGQVFNLHERIDQISGWDKPESKGVFRGKRQTRKSWVWCSCHLANGDKYPETSIWTLQAMDMLKNCHSCFHIERNRSLDKPTFLSRKQLPTESLQQFWRLNWFGSKMRNERYYANVGTRCNHSEYK